MHLSHIPPNGSQCGDVHWRHISDGSHCSRMQMCSCWALCKCGAPFFLIVAFSVKIGAYTGSDTLAGCWTSCEPSCEDVHNSLSPPGTLYFHGPASDVNAPAVLWIVRTDYSVGGGDWKSLWCVSAACDVSVRVRVCVCVHVCLCLHRCKYAPVSCLKCACMWSVNVSLTSGACVCVKRVCVCVCSEQKPRTVPWMRNVLKWMRSVMWG